MRIPWRERRKRIFGGVALAAALGLGSHLALAQLVTDAVPIANGERLADAIGAGEARRFTLELEAGSRVLGSVVQQGVDLIVLVTDPEGGLLAVVNGPGESGGTEPLDFTAATSGTHTIEISPYSEDSKPGRFEIRIDRIAAAAELAAEEKARASAATAWLAEHAVNLAGVESGRGFADLEPLAAKIGDARLVALGGATLGTRELFRAGHRLLEYLVAELGFTAFAIDANLPEAFDVDRWVQGGAGEGDRALAGLYVWSWNTEEMMDLLDWMRAWNADPAHARKVRFYGIDAQVSMRAGKLALAAFSEIDAAAAAPLAARLALATSALDENRRAGLSADEKVVLVAAAKELEAALAAQKPALVARRGALEAERALRSARVLVQALELDTVPDAAAHRERAMAENVAWVVDQEGAQGRVLLFAHNVRLLREPAGAAFPRLGQLLAARFGDALRVVGSAFDEGSFQARSAPPATELTTFAVAAAPDGSLDSTLADTGLETAIFDLDGLPKEGPAGDWFEVAHGTRSIGPVFLRDADALRQVRLGESYDLLLFVRRTSAARAMPSAAQRRAERLAAPANLDFEEEGLVPPAWRPARAMSALGYRLAAEGSGAAHGARGLCIHGEDAGRYGESAGAATQIVDATPFRGRRLRLSAAVRTEGEIVAQVALRPSAARPGALAFARSHGKSDWIRVTVESEIAAEARELELRLEAEGKGKACFDDLSIETLDPAPAAAN